MAGATNTTLGTIKLAGDFIGSHAEAPSLRPSGVKAGTYNITDKVYVDAQGRITWAKQLPEDFAWPEGSKTAQGIVQVGLLPDPNNKSIDVDDNSKISINLASASDAGVAKLGNGLTKNVSSGATDIVVPNASTSVFGFCRPDNTSMQVESDGTLHVDGQWVMNQAGPATTTTVGGVKVGDHFAIDSAGDLSTNIPTATSSAKGLASVGSNIQLAANTIDIPSATNTTYGTFVTRQPYFYIDDSTHTMYCHTCASPYFGNPDGLIGYVRGVSGASMSIDWPTSTISCSYNFSDFSATASTSVLGKVQVGDRIDVTDGTISLPDPTDTVYGPIKATGRSFKIDSDGRLFWDTDYWASTAFGGHVRPDGVTIKFSDVANAVISHDPADTPVATTTSKGIVQAGSGFNVSSGVLSVPDATTSAPGIVQLGDGIGTFIDTPYFIENRSASKSLRGLVTPIWKMVSGVAYTDPDSGLTVDASTLSLRTATTEDFGGVKVGSGIKLVNSEVINCLPELATTSTAGTVLPGNTLYNEVATVNGTAHTRLALIQTPATTSAYGLIKPSEHLNITNDALNVNTPLKSMYGDAYGRAGVITTIPDSGISISSDSTVSLAFATKATDLSVATRGIVQPNGSMNISADGTLSVTNMMKYNKVNAVSGGQMAIKNEINIIKSELTDSDAASIIYLNFGDMNQSSISIKLNFNNFMNCLTVFENKLSIVYKVSKNTATNLPVTITFTNQSNQSITPVIGSSYNVGDLVVINFVPSGKNIPVDGITYFNAWGTTSWYFQDQFSTQYQVYTGHQVFN